MEAGIRKRNDISQHVVYRYKFEDGGELLKEIAHPKKFNKILEEDCLVMCRKFATLAIDHNSVLFQLCTRGI